MFKSKKFWVFLIVAIIAIGTIAYIRHQIDIAILHADFVMGNGRLEADEINIASQIPERVTNIYVEEGDLVVRGQKLVQMKISTLNAKLAQAEAQVNVKKAEIESAKAMIAQTYSLKDAAEKRYRRTDELHKQNVTTDQEWEDDEAKFLACSANYEAALSHLQKAEADLEAAKADCDVIREDIKDCTLYSPRRGRIQYKVAQEGEVIKDGGRVLNMVDLTNVYMTFFLPERAAGRVEIGSDVRIVLDAIPEFPIPAKISYVASTAQFTPKTVETQEERQKMMFRVKARIDSELLERHIELVKTGLPGVAWVRLNEDAKWSPELSFHGDDEQTKSECAPHEEQK